MSLYNIFTREQRNFQNAVRALQEALPRNASISLEHISIPEFDHPSSIDSAATQIERVLEQLADELETQQKRTSRSQIIKQNLRTYFRSSFHFAQLFLLVARDSSAV